MKIQKIINEINNEIIYLSEGNFSYDIEIESICYDSRKSEKNSLFAALKGFKSDGNNYVNDAEKLGAVAVISEEKIDTNLFLVQVKNARKALSMISAFFYGNPSEKLFLIGITGTNGKTTTSYLIEKMLRPNIKTDIKKGIKTGVIGTVNYRYNDNIFKNPVTTPESYDLQKIFFEMQQSGVTHVILEVSSHSIDLFRIHDCLFDVAVFTNLTQDHLDYHKNMEEYGRCKALLFNEYIIKGDKKDKAWAVINCLNEFGKNLYDELNINKISIKAEKKGSFSDYEHNSDYKEYDITPENILYSLSGIKGEVNISDNRFFNFSSHLIGKHNLENILCAAGACIAAGIDLKSINKGIADLKNVPGRLERVENNSGYFVFVDYAHTPDALENVILALSDLKKGRLITVFGCGGDRDAEKRPIMGSVAAKLSDITIVTSDNPRYEDKDKIIEQITVGILKENITQYLPKDIDKAFDAKGYFIESDRKKAINFAIKIAKSGDIVLIAGKGHENYQIIGDKIIDFDDKVEAKKALYAINDRKHN
jgi:UDP-N-acetylmuramoyl-L-alanyl-D-glutamate--2,6-diaminopimelate ligase